MKYDLQGVLYFITNARSHGSGKNIKFDDYNSFEHYKFHYTTSKIFRNIFVI